MKPDEIKKALVCCSTRNCTPCPLDSASNCTYILIDNAYKLIKHQQEEIKKFKILDQEMDYFARQICNIRMSKEKKRPDVEDFLDCINIEINKAIKEFSESLIEKLGECRLVNNYVYVGYDTGDVLEAIQYLVAKKTGEKNG